MYKVWKSVQKKHSNAKLLQYSSTIKYIKM